MKICVYGASSAAIDSLYLDTAFELGKVIAEHGDTLIFGGGNTGVMGASAEGALSAEGTVIGIAPRFFDEPGVLHKNCTQFIYTETMHERKAYFEAESDVFVMAPGGIGTFEEFFETITLKQLGKLNQPLYIYNVNGYFDGLIQLLQNAISQKFMQEKDRELWKVITKPEELYEKK